MLNARAGAGGGAEESLQLRVSETATVLPANCGGRSGGSSCIGAGEARKATRFADAERRAAAGARAVTRRRQVHVVTTGIAAATDTRAAASAAPQTGCDAGD